MIRAFLRMFSGFAELELELEKARASLAALQQAYASLDNESLLTQDRLDAALAEREKLWSLAQTAMSGERESYRSQINFYAQRSGAGAPWPESHHVPAESIPHVGLADGPIGRNGRILPSEQTARAGRKSLQQIVERLAPK